MESSKLYEDTEECSSSESGWTMYIASPMHHNDDFSASNEDDDHDGDNHGDEGDNDSDDSMVSDASSGPPHREHPYGHSEGGHGSTHFEHDQEKNDNKYNPYKQSYKQKAKKKDEERGTDAEKQDSVLMAYSATSPIPSGSKVRKTMWMNKEK